MFIDVYRIVHFIYENGVVVGATCVICDRQCNRQNKKRHPTIEDDVIIYANAIILGDNQLITESVAQNDVVTLAHQE